MANRLNLFLFILSKCLLYPLCIRILYITDTTHSNVVLFQYSSRYTKSKIKGTKKDNKKGMRVLNAPLSSKINLETEHNVGTHRRRQKRRDTVKHLSPICFICICSGVARDDDDIKHSCTVLFWHYKDWEDRMKVEHRRVIHSLAAIW